MAAKKKRINLSEAEINAAAEAGRKKTEEEYAKKAGLISSGYKSQSSAKNKSKSKDLTISGNSTSTSNALAANNPAYVAAQKYGDGKTGTAANKAVKGTSKQSTDRKPGQINALGAGTYTAPSKAATAGKSSDIEWYKKILRSADAGLTRAGQSVVSALDTVASLGDSDGGPLQELWYMFGGDKLSKDNPIRALNKQGQAEVAYREERDKDLQDSLLYKYGGMTTEALAMMAPTIMTGGASTFGKAATEASKLAAASEIGQATSKLGQTAALTKNAVKNFSSRPDAQYIFGTTLGDSYAEAKQDGVDDLQALTYAVLNGTATAASELGGVDLALGGTQSLPQWVKNAIEKGDKSLLLNYVKSIGEEASEEIIQGIMGRGLKSIYTDVPLYDSDNPNSVINPSAMAEEATGAAVVAALLGLPTTGINAYYRAKQRNANANTADTVTEVPQSTAQSAQASPAQTVSNTDTVQNAGQTADTQTVAAIIKAANGAQLTAAEQQVLDADPYAQQAVSAIAQKAVDNTPQSTGLSAETAQQALDTARRQRAVAGAATFNPTASAQGVNAVAAARNAAEQTTVQRVAAVQNVTESIASDINVAPAVVQQVYNLKADTSPEVFKAAFETAYAMGEQGAKETALSSIKALSPQQASIAYNIGAEKAAAAANTQEVNENGVHLRGSGQRLDGQNTAGQVSGLAESTGRNTSRQTQGQSRNGAQAAGNDGQEVVYKGAKQKGVRYTTGKKTESMRKAEKTAKSHGYSTVFFEGGNIQVDGGEARGVIDPEAKTVYVRTDHPDFTANQIMRHEMGHADIAEGKISLDKVREDLHERFTDAELDEIAQAYADAYEGANMTIEEAFEEICCDALGDMNVFAGTGRVDDARYSQLLTSTKKSAERQANQGRAPPKDKGVKYSYEGKNKDGIEVYETSDEVMNLSISERNKRFLKIMKEQYKGRTAKFVRNGHAYYATFELADVNKNIYGDTRSDTKGQKAKVRTGADGNIFEIVENSRYSGSKAESGKSSKAHRGIGYWDYFIKTVQIDNTVYDLVANVRKTRDNQYVYGIQLRENKKIKASPAVGSQNVSLSSAANTSDSSIPGSSENVNTETSLESKQLTELRRENERKLAEATEADAQNENERGLIKSYKKQYNKVLDIAVQLDTAKQELSKAESDGATNDVTKAKNRVALLNRQYAREHRKLNSYKETKALQNVLSRVNERTPAKDSTHIDNRSFSNVGDRKIKPFQMQHPELHKYYKDMAETVLEDIGMSTLYRSKGGYAKTKFTKDFKRALGGSTFDEGIKALEDIVNDKGAEDYALAKRMEVFLDDLLSNGYVTGTGTVRGNREYIQAKEKLGGGNTAWENYLEENSLALADGLVTEDELYQEFLQIHSGLPQGMGAASAAFEGTPTAAERWVSQAQAEDGNDAMHPISREQEENLAKQQHRTPQEVPKKDPKGKLTSKHVSTIINSGITPAEFSAKMLEDAEQGKFSHIAYSDKEALAKATKKIEADGWEDALAEYKANVNSGKVSKDITVMGIALYNNAVNNGDYATAMDIASLMVKNSKTTAQALQAMRILNRLSPECRLYLAARSVENIQDELNERYKDNKADIHVDKVLYDEYANALRSGEEARIKEAWAKIEQNVAQQINATWYEKLNQFRYLAMLGNPRTHIRNIVGNAFFVPVRAVKNTIAYGLETAADKATKGGIEKSKAILNPSNANDAALIKYANLDYDSVQDTIMGGGKYVDTFQGVDKHRTIYKKVKPLEKLSKGNSELLDKEDAWFCKPAYAHALAKWYKANGISAEQLAKEEVPEETIIKAQTTAIKEAQKATYRDLNWFSEHVNMLNRVKNKPAKVLVEGLMPFKKTPANILSRALEYSPAGLIKTLTVDTKKLKEYVNGDVENGMSPAQYIDNISSGLTGTALVGLGVLLASMGVLSGGDGEDEKQNNFDELKGSQNYALNVGGMSITLDWLAPESMPLFVGVEMFNAFRNENEDNDALTNFIGSLMDLADPMLEMSMLQSVSDLFDNLQNIEEGHGIYRIVSGMATSYITQYFPTLLGQAERAFTEEERETTYIDRNSKANKELRYLLAKIANKIPGYDYSQIPYIDAWGRRESTGNLLERTFNNFLNPAYVKEERNTPIDSELERLYELGETSVYPTRAATNAQINGKYLTADEYVTYATEKGQISYNMAEQIINSSEYRSATDGEKAYMLETAYRYANNIAKYKVDNDYDVNGKWIMTAYESGDPAPLIIDHAMEWYKEPEE